MKITNKLNLPQVFVNYATSDKEYQPNRYSVTELLGSVREILLTRLHANEIKEDVADCIPALLGSAVHKILEENAPEGSEPEFKIEVEFKGKTIVGIIDLLNREQKLIEDYKTCSVSKIMKQDFNDWYLQGGIYAYLILLLLGIKIKKLKFYAIMKDWSKIKCYTSANYPSSAVYVWEYDLKDSDYIYIEQYLSDKLTLIDSGINQCTDEEKWYTGDSWAVYKQKGDAKAIKLCSSEIEAKGYLENKLGGNGFVEKRQGECLKCNYYCKVKEWCKNE